jgi:predicted nucleic acid-binding protein
VSVLVDSSVWIDYFRAGRHAERLEALIEENQIVTNELILAELVPALQIKRQNALISLLREIERTPLAPDWDEIIRLQVLCLRHGINAVGIPDLLIVQNALQNDLRLMARDRHFALMSRHIGLQLEI